MAGFLESSEAFGCILSDSRQIGYCINADFLELIEG